MIQENSLLIIVDPFKHLEPEDFARFPDHEKECYEFAKNNIFPMSVNFKNVVVATWGEREIYSFFQNYKRVYRLDEIENIENYEDIYFCGFHYGRCILNMPIGVRAMLLQGKRCNVLETFSMLFPADSLEACREKTKNEGALICKSAFSFINDGIDLKSYDGSCLDVYIYRLKFDQTLTPEKWPKNLKKIVLDFSLESCFRFLEKNSKERSNLFFSLLPEVEIILRTCDTNIRYVENILKKIPNLKKRVTKLELYPLFSLYRVGNKKKECRKEYKNFRYNKINKAFIFLNRTTNYSRNLLFQKILYREDIKKSTYTSWLNRYNSYSIYDGTLKLDDDTADKVQHFFPKEYTKALCDIYCETNAVEGGFDPPMITEKTWRPLLCGHLFLGFGYQNMYSYLQTLGFKLYDEVLDYTFDEISCIDSRMDAYFNSIDNFFISFNSVGPEEIFKKVNKKISFNKAHAQELAKHALNYRITK
jgi:hypothetical protein